MTEVGCRRWGVEGEILSANDDAIVGVVPFVLVSESFVPIVTFVLSDLFSAFNLEAFYNRWSFCYVLNPVLVGSRQHGQACD